MKTLSFGQLLTKLSERIQPFYVVNDMGLMRLVFPQIPHHCDWRDTIDCCDYVTGRPYTIHEGTKSTFVMVLISSTTITEEKCELILTVDKDYDDLPPALSEFEMFAG